MGERGAWLQPFPLSRSTVLSSYIVESLGDSLFI